MGAESHAKKNQGGKEPRAAPGMAVKKRKRGGHTAERTATESARNHSNDYTEKGKGTWRREGGEVGVAVEGPEPEKGVGGKRPEPERRAGNENQARRAEEPTNHRHWKIGNTNRSAQSGPRASGCDQSGTDGTQTARKSTSGAD